jgi:hypothetical protein
VKTRLILKPGQRGTKNLVEKYGEALLCVRFRYDAELRQRLKTVELRSDTFVPLRIEAADIPMRLQAKAAGGRWNPGKRLWFVKYGKIAGTPLEKHLHIDDR